jgi:hypothetical protein
VLGGVLQHQDVEEFQQRPLALPGQARELSLPVEQRRVIQPCQRVVEVLCRLLADGERRLKRHRPGLRQHPGVDGVVVVAIHLWRGHL